MLQRHQLGQWIAADDDAGGMGRGVARDTLELVRQLEQLAHLRVAVAHLAQSRRDVASASSSLMPSWFGMALAIRSTSP